MTPLGPEARDVIQLLAAGLGLAALGLARLRVSWCAECPHCQRADREAKEAAAARRHDLEHRGWGWQDGAQDWMACGDPECPRNPEKSSTSGMDKPPPRG